MPCQHEGCLCDVEGGGRFCSEYCEQHAGGDAHAEHRCECGHAACNSMGE
jgi:hypothetical protein